MKKIKRNKKNKKPLSLYPIKFDEALGVMLTVCPKKEEKKKKTPKSKK